SLHAAIAPAILVQNPASILENVENIDYTGDPNPKISIKLATHEISQTIASIEAIWKKVAPDQQFGFTFVDQALDAQYRQEQRLGKILGITTALGIWIACFGL